MVLLFSDQTALYFSAAAKTKKPLMIKRHFGASLRDWLGAAEYALFEGNEKIILCERGNIFGYNNLVVDILNFQIMKESTKPVFFDVTHSLQQPGTLEKSTGGRGE